MKNNIIALLCLLSITFGSKLQLINAGINSNVVVYAGDSKLDKNLATGENLILESRNQSTEITLESKKTNFSYSFNINESYESDNVIAVMVGSELKKDNNFQIIQTKMQEDSRSKRTIDVMLMNTSSENDNFDLYVDGSLICENLGYGKYSDYIQIPNNSRLISLHNHRESNAIAKYNMPEKNLSGKAGTLIINNNNEYFNLVLTMSNGESLALDAKVGSIVERNLAETNQNDPIVEIRETAQVQIVHNSPSPDVDIYVDGTLAVENFSYRSSTGLVDLPLNTVVGIAPAGDDIIAEFPFALEQGVDYIVVASGILNNTETPFTLLASTLNQVAQDNESFALKVLHGVTDAPAVDIYANGSLVIDSLVYGDFTDYLQLPVGNYTIDVTAHGAQQAVASFSAPLIGLGGGAGILYASGFLAGADTDPAFALVLTTPSSYVVELPATETYLKIDNIFTAELNEFTLSSNYPNPFNPITSIRYNLKTDSEVTITIYDLLGNVVNKLFKGTQNAGSKKINWNATNNAGDQVSSGVYIYKIETNNSSNFGRMMYLK
jgi:hypothetical protein